MPHLLPLLLTFCLSLNTFAADAAKPDDAKLIKGTWKPTQAELGGKPLPDTILKAITMKLDNGNYHVTVGDAPDNGTYKIDPTTTPKNITVTGQEGPNKGKTFPAIYELTNDTLRICYDLSGEKTPTEFKTDAGTKLYLVTYKRQKE